jgi:hypothetical protein
MGVRGVAGVDPLHLLQRVFIRHGDVEPPAGAQDAAHLQEPGVVQLADMGPDRPREDQPEMVVFKGQMRRGGVGEEMEGRRQMRLRPVDRRRMQIDAPDLGRGRLGFQMPQHPPAGTAEFQDALAHLVEPVLLQQAAQGADVGKARLQIERVHIFAVLHPVVMPQAGGGHPFGQGFGALFLGHGVKRIAVLRPVLGVVAARKVGRVHQQVFQIAHLGRADGGAEPFLIGALAVVVGGHGTCLFKKAGLRPSGDAPGTGLRFSRRPDRHSQAPCQRAGSGS